MAVISDDIVRELAGVKGNGAPVTTCYLDVDGRRHRAKSGYEQTLGQLLREARPARDDVRLQHDLDRIERYVRSGIDRSRTRGLAIFACSAADLWRVINLPVPVRDQLIVNDAPAVGQLRAASRRSGASACCSSASAGPRARVRGRRGRGQGRAVERVDPRHRRARREGARGGPGQGGGARARPPAPGRRPGVRGVAAVWVRPPRHRRARRPGPLGRAVAAPVPARPAGRSPPAGARMLAGGRSPSRP